jgi:autotransporter-associated beta strand protein
VKKILLASSALSLIVSTSFAHTNSVGFLISNSSASSCVNDAAETVCYDVEVFYGTWHSSTSTAEGDLAVFEIPTSGTEVQVIGQSASVSPSVVSFSMNHSQTTTLPNPPTSNPDYSDTTSAAYTALQTVFTLGSNYFFHDDTNNSLVAEPNSGVDNVYAHQSAVGVGLAPGTYRIDYDAATVSGLSQTWDPQPAISTVTFTIGSDGTLTVQGDFGEQEITELLTALSSLKERDSSQSVLSIFDGGELVIDQDLPSSGTGSIATFKIRDTTGRGRLNVGTTDSFTVASVFENFDGNTTGGLEKVGTGTLRLTADSTYTGATVVSAGTLDLAGSLTSDITVASAGTLKGYGSTSGGLTSSGTVSPGNSPGTLSVAGPVVFNSTNNFVVELDGLTYDANGGAGTYDRLAVTGTASTDTFTAGGTLTPVLRGISAPANNDLVPVIGDTFRVVTTGYATGVSGAFTSIADPDYTDANSGMPTNTRFDVLYGGNYVDLVLTPDDLGTFAQAYGIQNMVNAAEALDTVRPVQGTNGTTDKDQFFNGLYGLTATQFAQALLQASGEIHAFALSDARDGWQSGVGVVRSASQDADRNYWLDVSGYDLSFDQDGIASSYDGTTQRLWVGTDIYQSEQYVLGVAVGVSNSDISTVDTGSAETKTTSLALYMNGSQGSFEYDGILSVNRSEIDTTRTVDLRTGALTNTSTSTARGAALTAQVGYRYDIEEAAISSLVWLRGDVDATKADGFVEDGSTVTALTVAEQDMRSAELSLGYTISGEIPNNDQPSGTWNLGIGASKTLDTGMPYVTRTMSLHGATWDVSVPQSGDVAKFASAGIDLPVGEDASMWLNVAASERDGALAKSAAFGFQVQW